MKLLHFLEIENFKTFGGNQRLELENPSVFIGPNNAGKTSAIQALALWSLAVKTWYSARKNSHAKERTATGINRLNIVAVPVQKTRFFWKDTKVRNGNELIEMSVSVGVLHENRVKPLRMVFKAQTPEVIHCEPDGACAEDLRLLDYVSGLNVELLYPMSGIETEEPIVQTGRINVLMGQGQTAQVLRNLCLQVYQGSPDDWASITTLMGRIFRAELLAPGINVARGSIELAYRQDNVREALDISMAGRGFQQLLLLFAYLFSHKESVLLIDEPDAHLELLRQRQIFILLRELAVANRSQVIIVTHSEVILEEAADSNLVLLLEGRAENLAAKQDIRNSLKHYGTEHYVKARSTGHVLYVEGSTDIELLRAFAKLIRHPAAEILNGRPNVYYVQDNAAEASLESNLLHAEGGFGRSPKEHFFALKGLIPSLRAVAILDADGRRRVAEEKEGLRILYWRRYELENYLVTPELLLRFVREEFKELDLFAPVATAANAVMQDVLLEVVFDGKDSDLEEYLKLENAARTLVWEAKTQHLKLSGFAEKFFEALSAAEGFPVLLRKGDYSQLVRLIGHTTPDPEIVEKLDAIAALSSSGS